MCAGAPGGDSGATLGGGLIEGAGEETGGSPYPARGMSLKSNAWGDDVVGVSGAALGEYGASPYEGAPGEAGNVPGCGE